MVMVLQELTNSLLDSKGFKDDAIIRELIKKPSRYTNVFCHIDESSVFLRFHYFSQIYKQYCYYCSYYSKELLNLKYSRGALALKVIQTDIKISEKYLSKQ